MQVADLGVIVLKKKKTGLGTYYEVPKKAKYGHSYVKRNPSEDKYKVIWLSKVMNG
jgi:hypothetical protein